MPRYRVVLAYDGSDFAGSQAQPGQRTVQGELEGALGTILGVPTRAAFAGRTDRGVHATGQAAAFDAPAWRWDACKLRRSLNHVLPSDLRVREAEETAPSFHPRFDATWREYRYWIAPGILSPFLGRYAWLLRSDIELEAMNMGAQILVGTHDFASFAGGGEGVPWSERAKQNRSTTRTVFRCDCQETFARFGPGSGQERIVEIVVTADGFLPRMVRNMVGALVEVGQGRQTPGWIAEVLSYHDRRLGSALAPAQGLTLAAVGYDETAGSDRRLAEPKQRDMDEGAA